MGSTVLLFGHCARSAQNCGDAGHFDSRLTARPFDDIFVCHTRNPATCWDDRRKGSRPHLIDTKQLTRNPGRGMSVASPTLIVRSCPASQGGFARSSSETRGRLGRYPGLLQSSKQ